jgi:hypothetical protein
VQLQLVVFTAILILGLVIAGVGGRLLGRRCRGGERFATSGVLFVAVGVLMVAGAARLIAITAHERSKQVSAMSLLDLDAPPTPPTHFAKPSGDNRYTGP